MAISPLEVIGDLKEKVRAFVESGSLNAGQGNAVIIKIDGTLDQLQKGSVNGAVNRLEPFIHRVAAFLHAGIFLRPRDRSSSMARRR